MELLQSLSGEDILEIVKKHLLNEGLEVTGIRRNDCVNLEEELTLSVELVKRMPVVPSPTFGIRTPPPLTTRWTDFGRSPYFGPAPVVTLDSPNLT